MILSRCRRAEPSPESASVFLPSPSRRILPTFFWARIMLYLCFIQTIAVSALILYIVISDDNDMVYRLVFLVGKIFALIICWDAVIHKNTIQAISFVIFTIVCLIYVGLQLNLSMTRNQSSSTTILYIEAVIIAEACCSISYIVLTWEIYKEYGWKIFKKLGANKTIHKYYMHHQVLIILMQLEVFFSIAVAVQLATLLTTQTQTEKMLQIGLGIPVTIFILALGFYSLVKENRVSMIFVIISHGATLGYFTYRLVKIFLPRDDGENPYGDIWKYLSFSLSIMLALNILTLINLMVCYSDFGKGLLEQIQLHRIRASYKETQGRVPPDGQFSPPIIQQRWELD